MTDTKTAFAGNSTIVVPEERCDMGAKLFTIGELSREFGVTLRALRFYENKGLISPQRRGSARLYSAVDRERLSLILGGKRLGFSLAEISRMISEKEEQGSLAVGRERCLEQIAMLEERKRGIEAAISELKQMYAKLVVSAPEPQRVAC